MSGRKRKAEDEAEEDYDTSDAMMRQTSSSSRPGTVSQPLFESLQIVDLQSQASNSRSSPFTNKRIRTGVQGRPLTLSRLLQTMDLLSMQRTVSALCEKHSELAAEFTELAPAPSVHSTLAALRKYEESLDEAFPYGARNTDYAFNRVRPQLMELLEALDDFTPHFLPPREQQTTVSLDFLDNATSIIHRIPTWDNAQNNHHKETAYEEMAKAWAVVIKEAKSRGGGIQIIYGGWHEKLTQHNQRSGGKLQAAVQELSRSVDWLGAGTRETIPEQGDMASLRQQLLAGTYGSSQGVSVTP